VGAIAAPLFLLYSYPYAEDGFMTAGIQRYLSGYARMVGAVISLLGPQIAVSGNLIHGRMFSMRIVQTCDAMEVNILLAAAIAGFPMPLGRRVATVLLSVVSLLSINVFRLCVLYWLGARAPSWFSRTHETLAPLFLVASALVIFLLATRRRVRRLPEDPA
jgi:exosortase/archaeosortase family protein